jgi:hypothetical protein
MTGDQSTDPEYAARMILQNKTLEELHDGYEWYANLRGITAHEVKLIAIHSNALRRK